MTANSNKKVNLSKIKTRNSKNYACTIEKKNISHEYWWCLPRNKKTPSTIKKRANADSKITYTIKKNVYLEIKSTICEYKERHVRLKKIFMSKFKNTIRDYKRSIYDLKNVMSEIKNTMVNFFWKILYNRRLCKNDNNQS